MNTNKDNTTAKPNNYEEYYLDWLNNFLTVGRFAAYYGWSDDNASQVICEGRALHEATCKVRS